MTKDLTPETTNTSPRLTAVVRGPSRCVGESQRRRELAAQRRQEERSRWAPAAEAEEPAVAAEDEPAQRALRTRDLLVERRQCRRARAAPAQLDRLRQPVEAELGRARLRKAPERGARLRRVEHVLTPFRGQELALEEGR